MTKVFSEIVDDVVAIFEYDFTTNGSDVCSDLIIEVDDKGIITEYYAHRFILSRRSAALQSIISALPQPKEIGGLWRLPIIGHTNPSVLKLLQFIYTGKAVIEVPLSSNRKGALGEAWELYRLAEQFEIESLSTFCEAVMRKSIGKPGDKQEEVVDEEGEDGKGSPNARSLYRESLLSVTSPSDSDAEACRDATNAAARQLIAADLNDYLVRNPSGTFIGWIASLHPENVHLDSRMWIEGNDWLVVWRDAVVNGLAHEKVKKQVPVMDWRKMDDMEKDNSHSAASSSILDTTMIDENGTLPEGLGEQSPLALDELSDDPNQLKLDESNELGKNKEGLQIEGSNGNKPSIWTSWFSGNKGGGGGNNTATSLQNGKHAVEMAAALLAQQAMEEGGLEGRDSQHSTSMDESLDPRVEEALESYTAAISDHNDLASAAQSASYKEANRRIVIENAVLDIVAELRRLKPTLAPLEDAKLKLRNVLQEIDDRHNKKQNSTSKEGEGENETGSVITSSTQSGESVFSPVSLNGNIDISFNNIVESPQSAYSPAVGYDTLSLSDEEDYIESVNKYRMKKTLFKSKLGDSSLGKGDGVSSLAPSDEMLEDGVLVEGIMNNSSSLTSPKSPNSGGLAAALKLAEETEISEEMAKNGVVIEEPKECAGYGQQSEQEAVKDTTEKRAVFDSQSDGSQHKAVSNTAATTTSDFPEGGDSDADIEMQAAHAMEEVRRLTEELYEEMLRHHDLEVSLETLDRERIRLLVNAETRSREVMHSKEFVASRFVLVEKRSKQAKHLMPLSPRSNRNVKQSSQKGFGAESSKVIEKEKKIESNKGGFIEDGVKVGNVETKEEISIESLMERLDKLEASYKVEDEKLCKLGEKFSEANIEVEEIVLVDEKEEKRLISNWWVMRSAADAALGRNGSPRNDERAVELLTVAAEAGCEHAQVILGIRHELGCGVRKDTSTAAKWYSLACGALVEDDSGDTFAMIKLAAIMSRSLEANEKSTPATGKQQAASANKESDKAKKGLLTTKLWLIAAGRGHPEALYRLGMNYLSGNQWGFTEQDFKTHMTVMPLPSSAEPFEKPIKDENMALKLLTRAADYSHARAAKKLASIYMHGLGNIEKDDNLAEKYLSMISESLLNGKNLGSRSGNSSIASSPASSFTDRSAAYLRSNSQQLTNPLTTPALTSAASTASSTPATTSTPSAGGGGSSLSSTFQPMFRISKSLSRVSSQTSEKSEPDTSATSKKKSIFSGVGGNKSKFEEEDEEEEDENWAIAAALTSVNTPIRDSASMQRPSVSTEVNSNIGSPPPIGSATTMVAPPPITTNAASSSGVASTISGSEEGSDKFLGSSLLKNFWGRGSAKKQAPSPSHKSLSSDTDMAAALSSSTKETTSTDITNGSTKPSLSVTPVTSKKSKESKKEAVHESSEFSKEAEGASV